MDGIAARADEAQRAGRRARAVQRIEDDRGDVAGNAHPLAIRENDALDRACAGARTVKGVVLANNERVSVAGNVASIVFDPLHGTSTPTGTLRLVDDAGRAVHHVVNVMGRVRSCTPAGVPGWRAC